MNTDSPEKQFLEATVDTLKATIAKNELDMKKLKESNELKAKRIVNLEAQVKEARDTITKNQCTSTKEDSVNNSQPKFTLENRNNSIEHNFLLLTSKLEILQFNFLAGQRTQEKETIPIHRNLKNSIYVKAVTLRLVIRSSYRNTMNVSTNPI